MAETAAENANTALSDAITAKSETYTARDEAEASKTAAETAAEQAKTAKEAAETAQAGALSAKAAAGTAMQRAEAAQAAAETAKTDAETAAQAAQSYAEQANVDVIGLYPTETKSGAGVHTDIGADEVPVKSLSVTQTAGTPMRWTLRRTGVNQFDKAAVKFKKGYTISASGAESANSNYAYTTTFIPVVPGARYVASGFVDRASGTSLVWSVTIGISFYTASKTFKSRYTAFGSDANPYFTVPADCCYIRFNCHQLMVGTNGLLNKTMYIDKSYPLRIQFEIVDDPNATTVLASTNDAYYADYEKTDYAVDVAALNSPTEPSETITTKLGENAFLLFPEGTLDETADPGATAWIDMRYRVDPTLAYNKLKAAVVAAASN